MPLDYRHCSWFHLGSFIEPTAEITADQFIVIKILKPYKRYVGDHVLSYSLSCKITHFDEKYY